jgi:two-component system, OmpR family, sensor kinase
VGTAPHGTHAMSLRLRLGLWYGALTGAVVLLVSAFTYAAHTRGHYDDLDNLLASVATHVAEEFATAAPRGTDLPLAETVPAAVALRSYDAAGQVLGESRSATFPAADPAALLTRGSLPPFDPLAGMVPSVGHAAPPGGAFGLALGADGTRWRLLALPVPSTGGALVAATPLDRVDTSIARFRLLIAVPAALGAAGSLLAGWLLAGRALRPVATLTATAEAIASSRGFGRRVPVPAAAARDELGRLATTFNGMLASLEQAYEAERRFVSDASHELRAPLTAIQGNLDLLERQPGLGEAERREAVSEASREARRLAQLVADLLALARADAGVALRRQPVELDRVALETFGAARHLAHGQRLEIGTLEPAVVEGDPDRLKQLLLILLDNALKYTPPDGTVTLALSRDGPGPTPIVLTVRDTGVGIPPDALPRVFERFYRADPARGRDPGGTGLGLPIARWIAEQHGGEIALCSQPGAGTVATVRLPGTV